MLLIQASGANSEPCQAYKFGILSKIVNGLKLILKPILWGAYTKTLRFYLFGRLDQWYEWSNWSENWKLKNPYLFRTFQSPGSWTIEFRVTAGSFQSLGSLGSLVLHFQFRSVLPKLLEIQCRWNSRIPAKTSETPIIT